MPFQNIDLIRTKSVPLQSVDLIRASLTRLSRPEVAGSAGDYRGPDGRIDGLLGGTEKKEAVGRENFVDAGQQSLARLLREVEHDVAQEDHVEAIIAAAEGQRRRTEVGLAEIAHHANLRFDRPVLSRVVEVADNVPGRQAAVDLNAVVAACWARSITSAQMSVPSMRMCQPVSDGKCSWRSMARL